MNFFYRVITVILIFNFYAGEAWQNIMLDCLPHKNGDEKTICESNVDTLEDDGCGSDTAYAYFISFYVLCSFLVSYRIPYVLVKFSIVC